MSDIFFLSEDVIITPDLKPEPLKEDIFIGGVLREKGTLFLVIEEETP